MKNNRLVPKGNFANHSNKQNKVARQWGINKPLLYLSGYDELLRPLIEVFGAPKSHQRVVLSQPTPARSTPTRPIDASIRDNWDTECLEVSLKHRQNIWGFEIFLLPLDRSLAGQASGASAVRALSFTRGIQQTPIFDGGQWSRWSHTQSVLSRATVCESGLSVGSFYRKLRQHRVMLRAQVAVLLLVEAPTTAYMRRATAAWSHQARLRRYDI